MPGRGAGRASAVSSGLVGLSAGQPGSTRPGSSLPVQRGHLIGRLRELAGVERLLLRDDVGLVTLTGPGGSGKTRLALAAAARVAEQFADGAAFVPLAPVGDPSLVVHAICESLSVRESGGRPLIERLKEYLSDRELLLVLDNLEHLLPSAPRISELLAACPRLKVLVTSRAVLHISGEHDLPVPPLRFPARGPLPDLDDLAQYEAVQLFVERAQVARPGLGLSQESAPAIAEICRRLDGLPLAIELAAARVRLLSPQALLSWLDRRLSLLTGGPADRPSHQQTLRGTIAWSYDLLKPDERLLLRRLAVFVGGCSLDAIERVVHGPVGATASGPEASPAGHSFSTLDAVTALVEQSLLQLNDTGDEPRLTMLETIREYASEQLEAADEAGTIRRRHAEYFLALAEAAEPRLLGPEQRLWLGRLDVEHDNIRAALAWSQGETPALRDDAGTAIAPAELGLRLAGALAWFWYIRCHLSEGRRWLEPLLAATAPMPPAVRGRGLVTLGRLLQAQSDLARSSVLFEEAIVLFRQLDDRWWTAFAIGARGQNAMAESDFTRAEALSAESLAGFDAFDEPWGIGWSMGNLGRVAQAQGQHERAQRLLTQSLDFKRQAGDPFALGLALAFQGRATLAQGDLGPAREMLKEAVRRCQEVGYPRGVGAATYYLGGIAWAEGRHEEAAALYALSLQVQRGEGFRSGIAQCLEGLASASVQRALAAPTAAPAGSSRQADLLLAARLFGAAEALRRAIQVPVPPVDLPVYEAVVTKLRTILGSDVIAAWEAGRLAPLEHAIEEGLASVRAAQPAAAGAESATTASRPADAARRRTLIDEQMASLTARERSVAALVARGLGNREISSDLAISRRTTEAHITAILNKLGFSTRTQIAVWAVEHGLIAPDPA